MSKDGAGIVTVIRTWSGSEAPSQSSEVTSLKSRVESALPSENIIRLEVNYKSSGIDAECPSHDSYLSKFRENVIERLQCLVNSSVEKNPEIKSRKKIVQEVYAESLAHLSLLREVKPTDEKDETILWIRKQLLAGIYHLNKMKYKEFIFNEIRLKNKKTETVNEYVYIYIYYII